MSSQPSVADDCKELVKSNVHSIHEAKLKRQNMNIKLFIEAEDNLVNGNLDDYIVKKELAIQMAKKEAI
jgi:hypothetical protein